MGVMDQLEGERQELTSAWQERDRAAPTVEPWNHPSPSPVLPGLSHPALTAHQLRELQNISQMGSPEATSCPCSHSADGALEGPTSAS